MKSRLFFSAIAVAATLTNTVAGTLTFNGQSAGPTAFISEISLTVSPRNSLKSIQFAISPKPGSVTRPVSATYSSGYLQKRGYFNGQTGQLTLPVFGLYANYANTVTLTSAFTDGSSQQFSITVATPDWIDPCNRYKNFTIVQPRTNTTDLSYDFILIKDNCGSQSPIVIDTDGAVRWVGTAGVISFSSIFFANGFYISSHPPTSSDPTGIARIDLDGTFSFVKDYSSIGVTSTGHHNIDPGKQGMILEVNTTAQTESVIMEVDSSGNVLHTWNIADIISAAMVAGGDDPSQFVRPAPTDWFHNNAVTYRRSDDSLIVSSRENFVICIDYKTGAIKWILGDYSKKWYQFPSLRKYAVTLGANTLPPIGQHAVSITRDGNLLLFDDGTKSLFQTPAGDSRTYSTPRKYMLDLKLNTAKEVWNYSSRQGFIYSAFCSSVYEDGALNYLIDYSLAGSRTYAELIGVCANGQKVFDYRFAPADGCGTAWNAIPIHLESLVFDR